MMLRHDDNFDNLIDYDPEDPLCHPPGSLSFVLCVVCCVFVASVCVCVVCLCVCVWLVSVCALCVSVCM